MWLRIRDDLPKKGRKTDAVSGEPKLPAELQGALHSLYGNYEQSFKRWEGALPLFNNEHGGRWSDRPNTILVDSEQLESGDGMTPEFKKIAAVEVEEFKAECRAAISGSQHRRSERRGSTARGHEHRG